MLTVAGLNIPLSWPVSDNETFWENFLSTFDGQAVPIGSTMNIPTGKMFGTYQWNTQAGSTASLPAATGSLMRVLCYVSVLATTNSHILKTAPSTDNFVGMILGMNNSTGATTMFAAASTSNTITLNRTNTGSVSLGEWVEAIDLAPAVWGVRGMLSASGAAFVTPFSHV
jgi:hypothetical protein